MKSLKRITKVKAVIRIFVISSVIVSIFNIFHFLQLLIKKHFLHKMCFNASYTKQWQRFLDTGQRENIYWQKPNLMNANIRKILSKINDKTQTCESNHNCKDDAIFWRSLTKPNLMNQNCKDNTIVRRNEHSNVFKQSEPARHLKENPTHNFEWEVLTIVQHWLRRTVSEALYIA